MNNLADITDKNSHFMYAYIVGFDWNYQDIIHKSKLLVLSSDYARSSLISPNHSCRYWCIHIFVTSKLWKIIMWLLSQEKKNSIKKCKKM